MFRNFLNQLLLFLTRILQFSPAFYSLINNAIVLPVVSISWFVYSILLTLLSNKATGEEQPDDKERDPYQC